MSLGGKGFTQVAAAGYKQRGAKKRSSECLWKTCSFHRSCHQQPNAINTLESTGRGLFPAILPTGYLAHSVELISSLRKGMCARYLEKLP